jgi:hypothetical protein
MTLARPMFPPRASLTGAPGAVSACPASLILESHPGASQPLAGEGEPQAAHPTCSVGVGAPMTRRTIMNILVSAAAAAASSTVMPTDLQASDQAAAVADLAIAGEVAIPPVHFSDERSWRIPAGDLWQTT